MRDNWNNAIKTLLLAKNMYVVTESKTANTANKTVRVIKNTNQRPAFSKRVGFVSR